MLINSALICQQYVENGLNRKYRITLKYICFIRVQPSLVWGVRSPPQLQQLNKCVFSCRIIVFMIVRWRTLGRSASEYEFRAIKCPVLTLAAVLSVQRAHSCCCSITRTSRVAKPAWREGEERATWRTGGKFREQPGELTPRNLDHPVSVGLEDVEGRRALIYGNPWRGFYSPPVPVLHPSGGNGDSQSRAAACGDYGWSSTVLQNT